MKLAYPLTHPTGKSLDMVLSGIFAFVWSDSRKTTLHKVDHCSIG